MSFPILILEKIFNPFSNILIKSTSIIDKRIEKKTEFLNAEELEHALDLTKDSVKNEEEKKILEGIVKFGQTDVKQSESRIVLGGPRDVEEKHRGDKKVVEIGRAHV